jgi:3-methyladenine DNA glycosylase AlkD
MVGMSDGVTAKDFQKRLEPDMRMGEIFSLAKEFATMDPAEISKLLDNDAHQVRVGALSIMDKQARVKKTTESRRRELFDLYLARLDRIDTWDLVDLGAPWVIGRYLFDKPRDVLYELAHAKPMPSRRTAMYACLYFLRQGDVSDTFELASIMVGDPDELVQKGYGGVIREAGKQALPQLTAFLDRHAATMPRTALRYAIEHLPAEKRTYYLGLRKA